MLAAHMDEIGFMVRYIEKDGWLRVQPLGGFDPRVLVAQRVLVHTREAGALHGVFMPQSKPIHLLEGKPEAAKLEEFYIDLGLPADTVREQVRIGDFVTMDRTLEQLGNRVTAKAMDDRAGVFTMIEAMRKLGAHKANVLAVATVQEEVGLRGAGDLGLHRRARCRHRARCDAGAGYPWYARSRRGDTARRWRGHQGLRLVDHQQLQARRAHARRGRAAQHPAPDGGAAARRHGCGRDAAARAAAQRR